jgi:hypothetical protein
MADDTLPQTTSIRTRSASLASGTYRCRGSPFVASVNGEGFVSEWNKTRCGGHGVEVKKTVW